MKKVKWLLVVVVVLVIGLIVAGMIASFRIGDIIKKSVESAGPKVAQVDVKLAKASLSVLGGSASISGLVVGNPQGYKSESAIKVGQASLAIVPGSVFSDKVVIKSINVQAPEITIEGGLKENNLTQIQKNIASFTGGEAKPADDKAAVSAGKKLQVDDVVISGAKINAVMMGKTIPLTMPDIHIAGLGQGPDGITAADLSKRILNEIVNGSLGALASKAADLGRIGTDALKDASKSATDALKNAGLSATNALNQTTKGVSDLFKKKK